MSTRYSVTLDPKAKKQADQIYKNMGMNFSSAIRMFIQQTINDRALPFKPHESTDFDADVQDRVNRDIDNFAKTHSYKKHHLINE